MKESFVNNLQELMAANQNQRIKITYLERQKKQMEQYIKDLKQSLKINKETLTVINNQGPNNQAITKLNKENQNLLTKVNKLYDQNRELSAVYLMQCQFKIQERIFSNERISQFENRILDLRKYLQDKETSFSQVITRLKKYQEIHQKTVSQKIGSVSSLQMEKITSYMMTKICEQRNAYKQKLDSIMPEVHRLLVLKQAFSNKVNYERFMEQIHRNQVNQDKNQINNHKSISQNDFPKITALLTQTTKNKKQQNQIIQKNKVPQLKSSEFNKQLIRLLKKQKINNQILEDALNEAIQKNQELLKINQNLQNQVERLYKIQEKVRIQNLIFAERLKQVEKRYGGKYSTKKCKDDLSKAQYLSLVNVNVNEYEIKLEKQHRKTLIEYLKDQINTLYQVCSIKDKKLIKAKVNNEQTKTTFKEHSTMKNQEESSVNVSNIHTKILNQPQKQQEKINENQDKRWMIKSASEPRIGYFDLDLSDYELDEEKPQNIQIQQI